MLLKLILEVALLLFRPHLKELMSPKIRDQLLLVAAIFDHFGLTPLLNLDKFLYLFDSTIDKVEGASEVVSRAVEGSLLSLELGCLSHEGAAHFEELF